MVGVRTLDATPRTQQDELPFIIFRRQFGLYLCDEALTMLCTVHAVKYACMASRWNRLLHKFLITTTTARQEKNYIDAHHKA